jgi:hypothetical protein
MKTIVKIFVVILGMMFVSSCSNDSPKERYEGFEFEYNGHSYIEFRRYTGNSYYRIGTVHNPDCECNNVK